MAVEIPVVIDIDKAFIDAAKKVGANMHQIEHAVEANNIDLFPNIGESVKNLEAAKTVVERLVTELKGLMSRNEARLFAPGDLDNLKKLEEELVKIQVVLNQPSGFDSYIRDLSRANIELLQMREYYKNLEESSMRVSTSLNGYSSRLRDLNSQWANLTAAQKFNADGTMTAEAKALYEQFRKENLELQKQGQTLGDLLTQEQRRLQLSQQGAQKRKYETAILNTTAKTMAVLQEQERILSERLSKASFGTDKYNKLKTQLQGVRQEIERINKDINGTSSAMDGANSRLMMLLKNSLRLVALHAGTRFIRNVREVTAEFELQKVALGSIIQDTERAEDLFKQIKAAAIESPFEIKDLVSYTKQLSAYQVETDKLFDTTMKLADVSAGLGVDMSRLILAYGQVRAASVLRGQELRQFTEAGIPLVEKLAEKFSDLRGETVKTGEVFQLISERAVPFRMIEEIFDDMTSAGEMFYKMQEKQAKTLAGQWANLKDSVSIMYDEIGNTNVVHGAMEALIQTARSAMLNWRSWASVIGAASASLLTYVGVAKSVEIWTKLVAKAEELAHLAETKREKSMRRFVTSLIGKTAAEKVSTIATNLHTAAVNRAAAANTTLATTFWNLTAAMLANPFGIIAVTLGSIIALVTTLSKKTRDVSKDIDSANASINALNKTTGETADLIAQYEELSKKTNLNTQESKKLRDISRELAKEFPKTAKGIDEQTGALTLNIEKLKEYNKEAEEAIKKGMQAQLEVNKETIEKNQKEIDKLTRDNIKESAHKARWWHPLSFAFRTGLSNEEMAENATRIAELADENRQLIKTNEDLENTLKGISNASEDSGKSLLSWQDKLIAFNNRTDKEGKKMVILTDDQIEGYTHLGDALEEIAKKYKEEAEAVQILELAIRSKTGAERDDIQAELDRAKARKALAKEQLDYYHAFSLTEKKTSSTSDKRLQNLKNEISEITNAYKKFGELRKYKDEAESLMDIGTLFPQLGEFAPTFQNTIAKLQSMLEDVKKQLARRPKDTVLLDMQRALETEISNLNFDKLKQDLDDSIKQLSDEIKRSETARDFYQSILNLTGDEDLAATMSVSVYGGIGQDFKERLQQQLNAALSSLDASQITDDLRTAFASRDFDTILANLDKFPEVWQQKLKEMAESSQAFDADRAKDLLKALEKAKTYSEQRVQLAEETARRMKEIEEMNVPQPVKDQLQKRNTRKEAEEAARLEYEAFKDTPMYIELFADLDTASVRMLTNMRENLIALKAQWKDLQPTELKELQSRINELDEQIAHRNPFKALISSIKEYREMQRSMPRSQADLFAVIANDRLNAEQQILEELTAQYNEAVKKYEMDSLEVKEAKDRMDIQAEIVNQAKEEAETTQEIANSYRVASKHIMDAAEGVQKWAGYVNTALDGIGGIVDAFGSDEFSESFSTIAEGTVKTLEGAGEAAMGVAKLLALNPEGILDLVSGISDLIVGIGGTAKKLNVQQLNKQIKEQARLIQNLEESYDSLSKSLDKAFGNERIYNFNKMMEVMAAEMEAYRKQAEAERAKGKKADEDTALGYERSARDLDEKMRDLREQQDAFFAGADLASAAESFADAWLSAYEEFGDTSTAIEERMTEMVQTLMKKAALSGIAQNILGNWYASLADVKDWNAQTIAEKWKEAMALVNPMVEGMQVFANSMQAEGVSLRNTVGQFTGISRDIAGASEESINGLAAGINTQNFYMSFMPLIHENVAQILTHITGGNSVTPATQSGIEGMPSVQTIVYNNLPAIRSDISDVLQLLKSVISVGNVAPRNYVAIK